MVYTNLLLEYIQLHFNVVGCRLPAGIRRPLNSRPQNTKPDLFKSIRRRAIEYKIIMDICKEQPQIEEWHLIGLLSSFPDISQDNERCHVLPACKTLSVPNAKSAQSRNRLSDLNDQVLVFKYKGFLHAIDNQCPHSSFPLKQGNVFDIEDIGTPHGAGIRCFRHGWKFDLFTGKGDSGPHKLNLWDIELRDSKASAGADKEVWVRRPPQAPN